MTDQTAISEMTEETFETPAVHVPLSHPRLPRWAPYLTAAGSAVAARTPQGDQPGSCRTRVVTDGSMAASSAFVSGRSRPVDISSLPRTRGGG